VTTDIAEATQTTEATTQADPATPESVIETELSAESQIDATQEVAGTEPAPDGTEPETDEEVEALKAAAAEAAREEERQRIEAERRQEEAERESREQAARRLDGMKQAFRETMPRLRSAIRQLANGELELTPQTEQGIVNAVEQFYAQASLIAQTDVWEHLSQKYAAKVVSEDFAKDLSQRVRDGKFQNLEGVYDAIVQEAVRKGKEGFFTEAKVKEREASAVVAHRAKLAKMLKEQGTEAVVSYLGGRGNPPESRNATTPAPRGLTLEEASSLPVEELIARRSGR